MTTTKDILTHPLSLRGMMLWLLGLLFIMGTLVGLRYIPGQGFTALIQFDEVYEKQKLKVLETIPHYVKRPTGFDGQFYAQIAFDPTLRNPEYDHVIDLPSYRCRRIFLPFLSYCLGLGKPEYIIHVYSLINLAFWFALLFLFLKLAKPWTLQSMYCVTGMALSLGSLESIRLALVDLPAVTLLFYAAWLANRKFGIASILASLAFLTRETMVLGALAFLPFGDKNIRSWIRSTGYLFLMAIPLLLWSFYIIYRFPGLIEQGSGNFNLPLVDFGKRIVKFYNGIFFVHSIHEFMSFLALIGIITQGVYLWKNRNWTDPIWKMGILFSIIPLFLDEAVWDSILFVARVVLPMTIAFNYFLIKEKNNFRIWFLLGNLGMILGLVKFATYKM
jgi:hypothetical protein